MSKPTSPKAFEWSDGRANKIGPVRSPNERNLLQFSKFAGLEDGLISPRGRFCRVMTVVSGSNSPQNFQKVTSTDLGRIESSDSDGRSSKLNIKYHQTAGSESDEGPYLVGNSNSDSMTEEERDWPLNKPSVHSQPFRSNRKDAESASSVTSQPSSLRLRLLSMALGPQQTGTEKTQSRISKVDMQRTVALFVETTKTEPVFPEVRKPPPQRRFADRNSEPCGRFGMGQPRAVRDQPRLQRDVAGSIAQDSDNSDASSNELEDARPSSNVPVRKTSGRSVGDGVANVFRKAWKSARPLSPRQQELDDLQTSRSTGSTRSAESTRSARSMTGEETTAATERIEGTSGVRGSHRLGRILRGSRDGDLSLVRRKGNVRELVGLRRNDQDFQGQAFQKNSLLRRRGDKHGTGSMQVRTDSNLKSTLQSVKLLESIARRSEENLFSLTSADAAGTVTESPSNLKKMEGTVEREQGA